jgi:NAD-dependent dihydropyrimidine dehydrogenase PreA subunit
MLSHHVPNVKFSRLTVTECDLHHFHGGLVLLESPLALCCGAGITQSEEELMYVVAVDVAKCAACGDCVDTCPNELIAMAEENGKQYAMYKGDPDECIGCYSCESGYAEGAITVTEL